jgi:hypothetical protein
MKLINAPHHPADLAPLRAMMRRTAQTQDMSVLSHGLHVARYFEDLRCHVLREEALVHMWRLPEWVHDPLLWSQVLPLASVRQYQIYHDCGKPHCLTVDEQGRRHFPDHARISEQVWASLGQDAQIGTLIGQDMDIHVLKALEVENFAQRHTAATLLLTGLAEIHANAEMFGGIDSVSFKIKYKQINQRGKAIVRALNEQTSRVVNG